MRLSDLTEDLNEGINDKAIFKAVFMAGGPGSGKSFVADATGLASMGFKLINSDSAFERYLDIAGLDKADPDDVTSPEGQAIRGKAKRVTDTKFNSATNGKLGLVIDGTGRDYVKIQQQQNALRQLGYDCAMIFVNTDLKTALVRNNERAKTGGRRLSTELVEEYWHDVQNNIGKFQNLFGHSMYIVDNSENSSVEGAIQSVYKRMTSWAKQPHKNPIAIDWITANTK